MNGASVGLFTFVLWIVAKGRFGEYVALATTKANVSAAATPTVAPLAPAAPASPTLPSLKRGS